MKNNFFIKTGYSLFESMLSIDDVIEYAIKNNLDKIALIETNFLSECCFFRRKLPTI